VISIIDYGAGNLKSISNALIKVGAEIDVAQEPDPDADAVVLPGVGNFGDVMGKIEPIKPALLDIICSGKPFLGLCLGLQVLFEGSEEAPKIKGLELLPGKCMRFKQGKVPHMGWNQLSHMRGMLFDGIKEGENFYFVHSYYAPVSENTIANCNYGIDFSAAVQKDNVYACQFHPERSGASGLKILENFIKEVRK
jgi:glutamine amidotransferase